MALAYYHDAWSGEFIHALSKPRTLGTTSSALPIFRPNETDRKGRFPLPRFIVTLRMVTRYTLAPDSKVKGRLEGACAQW